MQGCIRFFRHCADRLPLCQFIENTRVPMWIVYAKSDMK